MALSRIKAVCSTCRHRFTKVPQRTFMGFQSLECPKCKRKTKYPLTKGYRRAYWGIMILMVAMIIRAFALGGVGVPGLLGIAIIVALVRDRKLRKYYEATETIPETPTPDPGVVPSRIQSRTLNG